MAADRARIAAALAREEQRRRLMESVPSTERVAPAPQSRNLRRDLENLSIGVGEGITNQLEGLKGIVTDPIGSAKAGYEAVRGIVRDPSVLADALRYTAQKAGSGPLGAGEVIGEMVSPMRGKAPVMQEIDVYHGSPHRFEEFDASKIGTGEGEQVYGHGLYFAENPAVAKDYQDYFGREFTTIAKAYLKNAGNDVDKAIQQAKLKRQELMENWERGNRAEPSIGVEMFDTAINELNKHKKTGGWTSASLYTVDLPDEMVDRMLDWDKRISDQPEFVQKAWADWRATPQAQKLVKQMIARGSSAQDIEKMFANPTGEAMHKWIYEGYGSAKGGERPKVASFLKDKGLLGVKYQDAGSRGQGGTGTRNFVVFPGEEKKVKILKRE
jgi:hypothetical protein